MSPPQRGRVSAVSLISAVSDRGRRGGRVDGWDGPLARSIRGDRDDRRYLGPGAARASSRPTGRAGGWRGPSALGALFDGDLGRWPLGQTSLELSSPESRARLRRARRQRHIFNPWRSGRSPLPRTRRSEQARGLRSSGGAAYLPAEWPSRRKRKITRKRKMMRAHGRPAGRVGPLYLTRRGGGGGRCSRSDRYDSRA